MEMAESASLIRSESVRQYVDGRMVRWGVVMLYPDRLASVRATPLSLAVTAQPVSSGA